VPEGEQVFFIVEASDPNGTVPTLSAAPLPVGATFVDQGNGRGVFDWTPAERQAGVYSIVFTASDGALEATRRAKITVQAFIDTDGDDIDDDWERQYFGGLDRDGSGDFDRDGISDLDEFLAESDPAERADVAVRLSVDNMNPSVGDELILTVKATNKGLRDATGVEIVDLLSDGLAYVIPDSGPDPDYQHATGVWEIATLEPDTTATLNIKAQVTRPGRILNIAALSNADLYDPDRSNNSAALLLNGGSQSDLALALTADKSTPEVGEPITVALTVTNNGTDNAKGVEIEELLPSDLSYVSSTATQGNYDETNGIWVVGDLDSGAGAELLLTLTADTIDELILTAAISGSDQPDPDPTNNRSSIVINQDPGIHPNVADLAIHKLVNHSAVDVGGQAVVTLLVRNNGPDDAGNIEIDDLLPDGLAFQGAIPSGGNDDNENETWQWQVDIISAGSFLILDMIVDATEAGAQDNTATIIDLDEFDPDSGNDSDTITVTVNNVAPVVTAGADQTADEGQTVSFDASFEDPGADTHQISWDFGDGATAEGTLSPSHAYADNGSYTVSVTVTDDEGAADTGTLMVTVINVAPTVLAGADQTVDEGAVVSFSGGFTDPGADTHTIEWDFGDGAVDAGKLDPAHSYADDGQYTVTLTVKDDDGAEVSDTLTVTVNNVAPTVIAGADQTVDEGAGNIP
jgi:uncharacterized repeat protein (TIGR01451 family)